MVKNISNKEQKLIAQLFDFNLLDGIVFPTPETQEFQLGAGLIKERKNIPKHIHNRFERKIDKTSEFLFVLKGKMTIQIIDESGNDIKEVVITDNMALLQFFGGHAIEIEKDTRYFEIKQGPYLGKRMDKQIID